MKLFADTRFAKAGLSATGLWLMVRSYIASKQVNIITVSMCAKFCTHDEDPFALANILVQSGLWAERGDITERTWRMIDLSPVTEQKSTLDTYRDVADAMYEGNPNMVYELPESRARAVMQYIVNSGITRRDLVLFSAWYGKSNFKRKGQVPTFAQLTGFDMADFIEAIAMWRNSTKTARPATQAVAQGKPASPRADLSTIKLKVE